MNLCRPFSPCLLATLVLAASCATTPQDPGRSDETVHRALAAETCARCQATLVVRIEAFRALANLSRQPRVYVGIKRVEPDARGEVRVPLRAGADWIVDASSVDEASGAWPAGVLAIVREGKGRVSLGVWGALPKGHWIYARLAASVEGGAIRQARNHPRYPLERPGDGLAEPGNPSQDELWPPASAPVLEATASDDADFATLTTVCTACTPSCEGVVCHSDDPCRISACDPASGTCVERDAPDGTACDDGDKCTADDACSAGRCVPGTPRECQPGTCEASAACDPATGACVGTPAPDGTACDDGDKCTQGDACREGRCVGDTRTVCVPGACEATSTCDPASGACVGTLAPDGTACDDGNACTVGDHCAGGVCVGDPRDVCADPPGDLHLSYTLAEESIGSTAEKTLQYARGPFGQMAVEEVDRANHHRRRSGLVLDRSDRPTIVYGHVSGAISPTLALKVAEKTSDSWNLEVASTRPVNSGLVPAITIDGAGRVLASHQLDDAAYTPNYPPFVGPRELVVSERESGRWRDITRDQQPDWFFGNEHAIWWYGDTSVAIDRSDRGVLAYVRTVHPSPEACPDGPLAGSGLFLTREAEQGWAHSQRIAYPCLRRSADGAVTGLLAVGAVELALDDEDAWHVVYTTRRVVVDPAPNKCFVEYESSLGDHETIAAQSENTSGAIGGALDMCVDPGHRPAIAIDRQGRVHIAYWDNGIPVHDEQMGHLRDTGLWYARYDRRLPAGQAWERIFVDGDAEHDDLSIAVNRDGDPVIAYKPKSETRPKLAARFGATWQFTFVGDPERILIRVGDLAVSGERGRGPARR